MPVPTNTTAGTAIDVGTLTTSPTMITQVVDDGAGTVYTVWYKYTPTSNCELGLFPWGDASSYIPSVEIFQSDGVTDYLNGFTTTAVPIQVPLSSGQLYYFKFTSSFGGITSGTLTLRLQLAATLDAPVGAFLVNDDATVTSGLPAVLLDSATGTPLRFLQPFPSGEGGDVLPTGEICVSDDANSSLHVYTPDLTTVIGTVTGTSGQVLSIRTNLVDTFYVASPGVSFPVVTNAKVLVVDKTGTLVRTIPFGSIGMTCAAPSPDETVMYYNLTSTGPIKRWDLINNIGLSDLAATPAGYKVPRPLLVLSDATILVTYQNINSPFDAFVTRYSSVGATLNTYTFSLAIGQDFQLASASDDPTSFMAWEKRADNISAFTRVKVSDGSIVSSVTAMQFEGGAYRGTRTATPVAYFGHSESCPFLTTRQKIAAPVSPASFPSSPPVIPGTCCSPTPTSTSITSPKPSAGTNKGGVGSCTFYSGPSGVVPIGADPADGDTLTGKRTVYVWAEVQHVDY